MIRALYARDAAGLAVDMLVPPPPLVPQVRIDPQLRALGTAQAAADWRAWWEAEVAAGPQSAADLPDPLARPALIGPDLRSLLNQATGPAGRWLSAHERDHMNHARERPRPARHPMGELVRSIEAELGRPIEPFQLQVDVLPVEGHWSHRAQRDHLLVSQSLSRNTAAYQILLEPIIRSLA